MASYDPHDHSGHGSNNQSHTQNQNQTDALAALFRAAGSANAPGNGEGRDPASRFSSSLHQGNMPQSFYGHGPEGQDSSMTASASDVFPPPAPTPPMAHGNHFGPSSHMNLGPIGPPAKTDQSASLLNLLKFSGSGSASAASSGSHPSQGQTSFPTAQGLSQLPPFDLAANIPPTLHAPVPMPADPQGFLASLMKGMPPPEQSQTQPHREALPAPGSQWNTGPPADNTQAYLLNLLQRKKPSQNDQPSTENGSAATPPATNESNIEQWKEGAAPHELADPQSQDSAAMQFGIIGAQKHVPSPPARIDYNSPSSQKSAAHSFAKADYGNPFDDHMSSSSRNKDQMSRLSAHAEPLTGTPSASGIQILRKAPSASSSPGSRDQRRAGAHRSPLISPDPASHAAASPAQSEFGRSRNERAHDHGKESVAEAMEDLAASADKAAQEALARAERDEAQGRIERDLEEMRQADSDTDFQEKSELAARHLKEELDKKENEGLLEKTLDPELAEAVREIVDEAAHGHLAVADNWESAEADEIIVIEENTTAVKVYNFPMKPWISITVQENDETLPQFRDEVILDIARVKKEFDQIDRNLVSATETYIAYGMSKAGGLRVIRQDDGTDAKLFTDTKDRIFNIAVSSSPSDSDTTPKETIIGTGISGTVYYVQIKNGDKDYLDDPHPEQHGFALPPISTQEGDAPGGVLKTRARTSSTHPEYFAVGRGKTISIIWPAYIMQNDMFKPGHDRVVDTEKLSNHCSLRINTGKAGKDFTFSQDDTTIVSLDKSGRVKFWDVRDLTAADGQSDSRFPMPAQSSLEVKEPLMTLTTTPEGEKAWPTSVLLLDKQRPYQKRCALRYMIVGMKQNHTLQLWDLALGKPVQEFNLPHSKESDAVCSVMYHPPTGMIVVGHPTRNSVYFLHLSAPKYTVKGLSQVDYIQRLVASDSSIPEPDSTAVISGVREYSFANRGVIRSVDMLVSPAGSADDDEATLFELYAMHSKGVSGICIKHSELGWTRDNKVIEPVDAVEVGIVKITKLKELPTTQAPEAQVADESGSVALPVRVAPRPNNKENAFPAGVQSVEEPVQKPNDEVPLAKGSSDRKLDVPAVPANGLEKAEKKARKKREKQSATDKTTGDHVQSIGESQSPRIPSVPAKSSDTKAHTSGSAAHLGESVQSAVKQIETIVNDAIQSSITDLRSKLDEEFRVRDAHFNKAQSKLLELVSSTLDQNVQDVLTATISDKVEDSVIPAIGEVIKRTVSEQLGGVVSEQLNNAVGEQLESKLGGRISHAVQNQIQKHLPSAVSQALQRPDLAKGVSDKIVQTLAVNVENSFHDALHKTITPSFSQIAVAAATEIAGDVRRQAAGQIEELEQRIRADGNKIDQLTALVSRLSDTISTMATTQAQFQDQFLKFQQAYRDRSAQATGAPQFSQHPQSRDYGGSSHTLGPSYSSPAAHSNNQLIGYPGSNAGSNVDHDYERKLNDIVSLVDRGDLETALVKWLQSDRKEDLFKDLYVKVDVSQLGQLSPLVSLAVLAEISRELDGTLLIEKVGWMEVIIHSIHGSLPGIDGQVAEVIPNILGAFITQVEMLFMRINQKQPSDPILKYLSQMVQMANRIINIARNPQLSGY